MEGAMLERGCKSRCWTLILLPTHTLTLQQSFVRHPDVHIARRRLGNKLVGFYLCRANALSTGTLGLWEEDPELEFAFNVSWSRAEHATRHRAWCSN